MDVLARAETFGVSHKQCYSKVFADRGSFRRRCLILH